MNRIKIDFQVQNDKEKYYNYQVLLGTNIIYRGKAFKLSSQNNLVLDITDILNNYQYRGLGMLTPTWLNDEYRQPTETIVNLLNTSSEQHINTVTVKLFDGDVLISTINKQVYFHTIPFEGERCETLINGKYYYFGDLIPRMPLTDKLRYAQLLYAPTSTTIQWGTQNFGTFKGSSVINVPIPKSDISDGKSKILQVDKDCLAPYYLCWITKDGGFQCQAFKSRKSTYTENYTTNYKLSTDEQKDIANRSINGTWQLISDNLTETEYKIFMDINRSAYLLLYITEYDKVVYVNATATSNEQKTEANNNNKPLFYSVDLETREGLLNIN